MKLARSVDAEWRNKRFQLNRERLRRLLAHDVRSSGSMFKRYRASEIRARPVRHCAPTDRARRRPISGAVKQSRHQSTKLDGVVLGDARHGGIRISWGGQLHLEERGDKA